MATPLKATGVAMVVLSAIVTSVASLHAASSITLVPVLSGLTSPILVTNARDGSHRLFVVEQAGVIKVLQPGAVSPTVFLVIPQPFANHNGGMVEFGHDGFLYIAMGDGGSGNDPGKRAQNIDDLLGKILRIDVDDPNPPNLYSSPPSNPFFGATAGADEI